MTMQTFTLSPRRGASIADDLRLSPQSRKVLAHLEDGKSISQMEALTVYSIFRLAARVSELRAIGYDIVSELRQDEAGHRYARYSLAD